MLKQREQCYACSSVGVAEQKGGRCSASAERPIRYSIGIICSSACRTQVEAGMRAMCPSCEWAQPRHRAPGRPWKMPMWQC